ncbi:hypothetical protein SAMN06313486_1028 [Epsilonproteobacteria bacterium SCGC AD-308-P11]|jgi:hypothetical protein|nr:hypothetical protein SAMN06313486_1028 [Epsilonproteobacteria bacterium SCGC AD-308-P11]
MADDAEKTEEATFIERKKDKSLFLRWSRCGY